MVNIVRNLNQVKQSTTDALKTTSKQVIQKTAEATGDLIGIKTADKITKIWRSSPKNNSETITNEYDKEIPKERYISPEETGEAIDDLRLI